MDILLDVILDITLILDSKKENASTTSASFPVPKFVGFPFHPLENESRLL